MNFLQLLGLVTMSMSGWVLGLLVIAHFMHKFEHKVFACLTYLFLTGLVLYKLSS